MLSSKIRFCSSCVHKSHAASVSYCVLPTGTSLDHSRPAPKPAHWITLFPEDFLLLCQPALHKTPTNKKIWVWLPTPPGLPGKGSENTQHLRLDDPHHMHLPCRFFCRIIGKNSAYALRTSPISLSYIIVQYDGLQWKCVHVTSYISLALHSPSFQFRRLNNSPLFTHILPGMEISF